jgi:hypothetical protein
VIFRLNFGNPIYYISAYQYSSKHYLKSTDTEYDSPTELVTKYRYNEFFKNLNLSCFLAPAKRAIVTGAKTGQHREQ